MDLNTLKKGYFGEIVTIDAEKSLRDRLHSFGIFKGEQISVKETSLGKQNIKIEIDGSTLVALRSSEAEKIEIKERVKE